MPDIPHRAIAIQTYNQCWEYLERERTTAEDLELLQLAYTSRYHWQHAGGPSQWAISDWMVSRAAAAIGNASLALLHAAAMDTHDASGFPVWQRASLLEGHARALLAAGERDACRAAIAAADAILMTESDPEDAALIRSQIDELRARV